MKKILMKIIFALFIILTLASCGEEKDETNNEEPKTKHCRDLVDAIEGMIIWDDSKKLYLETNDTTYFGDFDIYLDGKLILASKDYDYCIPSNTTIEVEIDLDVNEIYDFEPVVGTSFVWMDEDEEIDLDYSGIADGKYRQLVGETNCIYGLTQVNLKEGKNILVFPQRQDVWDICNKSSDFSITGKYCSSSNKEGYNVAYCELTTTKDYTMQVGDLRANCYYSYFAAQLSDTDKIIRIDAFHEVYKTEYPKFELILLCNQKVLKKYGDSARNEKNYYKVTFPEDVSVSFANYEKILVSRNGNEFVLDVRSDISLSVKGLSDIGVNVLVKIQKCYCD